MNKVEKVEQEVADNERLHEEAELANERAYDYMKSDPELKAARNRVGELEAPHKASQEAADIVVKAFSKKKWPLEQKLRQAKRDVIVGKAAIAGKHTAESAHAALSSLKATKDGQTIGLNLQPVDEDKENRSEERFYTKATLKNGVKVFHDRMEGHGQNRYFAFDGLKLIGVWKKDVAEHRGDDQYSECWIGVAEIGQNNELSRCDGERVRALWEALSDEAQNKLSEYNFLEEQSKYRRGGSWSSRSDATFYQWKEEVENKPLDDLAIMELREYKSLQTLGRGW